MAKPFADPGSGGAAPVQHMDGLGRPHCWCYYRAAVLSFSLHGFCLNPGIMRVLKQSAMHQLVAWSSLLVLYLFLY